ncbi:MAG: MaoC family dehydratase [Gemmatimonadales bacterium]|nr:MaoC family dehydratase [Gemmatimonadales bacterium]
MSHPSSSAGQGSGAEDAGPRYLEDLAVGQRYAGGSVAVDLQAIRTFAASFDPQPFHLDEEAARTSVFGRLVASGWHTMALTMRLLVEGELRSAWGLIGLGADELRWPRPVLPGDVLHVEWEVHEVRPSSSKPDRGTARLRIMTRNQRDEVVLSLVTTILLPRRPMV